MNEDQNSANPQQPTPYIKKDQSKKIIQPSDESVQEVKKDNLPFNRPNLTPVSSTPAAANPTTENVAPQTSSSATAPPKSIYPEATKGFGISGPPPMPEPSNTNQVAGKAQQTDKSEIINVVIILLGLFMAVPSLLGLLNIGFLSIHGISIGFSGGGGILYVIYICYLLLGIGIILKKEIARIIYIVLAVLGLLLSIYTTYHYLKVYKPILDNQYSNLISGDQKDIQNYQTNNQIPAAQKAQIIHELQTELNSDKKQVQQNDQVIHKANEKLVVAFVEGYALALIPLVILTRPKVKEQFS